MAEIQQTHFLLMPIPCNFPENDHLLGKPPPVGFNSNSTGFSCSWAGRKNETAMILLRWKFSEVKTNEQASFLGTLVHKVKERHKVSEGQFTVYLNCCVIQHQPLMDYRDKGHQQV